MKKVLSQILADLKQPLALAQNLWAKEPTRVVSVVAAAVVFVCAKLGVVVPEQSVATAAAYVLPILLGGELIRSQVSPVASLPKAPPVAAPEK